MADAAVLSLRARLLQPVLRHRRGGGSLIPYNPALDGLRAVAVLAVIAFHAAPELMPGGFLGVDIFFVLSGYLITRILVGDIKSLGHVNFRRFYLRRARRLLPA